ncbi:MAG TPA: glucosaminidase domain-containing protein [Bacillota bacterium]|nr:glucosaminidase domain-containing protein [Bacillota bacterium]
MSYEQYLDLDLNTLSGVSVYQLDAVLNGTSLQGLGSAFVNAENKYHMHAVYLLAHAIHESDFGRSQIARDKYNLFGFMAYDSNPYASAKKFESFEQCIDYCAGYIKRQYLTKGGKWYEGPTLRGMNVHYATDKQWAVKIARWMDQIYKALPEQLDYVGHWAEEAIKQALELGIAHGYPDGLFKPEQPLTRAEGVSMIMNLYKLLKG